MSKNPRAYKKDTKKELPPGSTPAPEIDLKEARQNAEKPVDPSKLSETERGLLAKNTKLLPAKKPDQKDADPWDAADPWEAVADEVDPWDVTGEPPPERPWYSVTPKGLLQGTVNALPLAGTVLAGPYGVLASGVATALGKTVENAVEHNVMGDKKGRKELYGDPIVEFVKGSTSEAAGRATGQAIKNFVGLGNKGTGINVPNLQKAPKHPAEPYVPPIRMAEDFREMGFFPKPKPNASEITNSAKAMGFDPTPGMLSGNPNIQNIESVLNQQPTMAGEWVRRSYEPVFKGLQNTADDAVKSTPMSKFETGESVKTGLMSRIREKAAPLKQEFEDIQSTTKHIQPKPENLKRSADRLLKQPLAEVDGLPQTVVIKRYSDMIRNAKSIDTLKQIKTSANEELTTAYMQGRGQEARALTKIKNAITRLERREIIKAAQAATPTKAQGDKAAKQLIDQMKRTNKGWAVLMGELQGLARAGKIGKRLGSPEHLVRIIDEMPSEQLSQRLFNTKNYKGLLEVKKFAPEEFELLRQSKLSEIAKKSMVDDVVNPRKLIKNMDAEGPEARAILFGPRAEAILSDLKNVVFSIPKKVGASDTPRGTMWMQLGVLSPSAWLQEGASAYNYMILQGGKTATIRAGPSHAVRGLLQHSVAGPLSEKAASATAFGLMGQESEK